MLGPCLVPTTEWSIGDGVKGPFFLLQGMPNRYIMLVVTNYGVIHCRRDENEREKAIESQFIT